MGRRGGGEGVTTSRAVVVDYAFGRSIGESLPEGNASRKVEAMVCLVDGDGTRQRVSGRLQGHAHWLMTEGDEISVLVDANGRVVDFDRKAVDAQYGARRDDLRAARKEQNSLGFLVRTDLGLDRRQLRDAVGIARDAVAAPFRAWRASGTTGGMATERSGVPGPPPAPGAAAGTPPPPPATAPQAPAVHGVDFTTFVAVQAALVREAVPPTRHDEVAARFGVPAGTWAGAAAEWHRRVRADPELGQAFGAAYQDALGA